MAVYQYSLNLVLSLDSLHHARSEFSDRAWHGGSEEEISLNHQVRWITWNETLPSALYSETRVHVVCEMLTMHKFC